MLSLEWRPSSISFISKVSAFLYPSPTSHNNPASLPAYARSICAHPNVHTHQVSNQPGCLGSASFLEVQLKVRPTQLKFRQYLPAPVRSSRPLANDALHSSAVLHPTVRCRCRGGVPRRGRCSGPNATWPCAPVRTTGLISPWRAMRDAANYVSAHIVWPHLAHNLFRVISCCHIIWRLTTCLRKFGGAERLYTGGVQVSLLHSKHSLKGTSFVPLYMCTSTAQ